MKITFPDKSVKEFDRGTTALQVAESISSRLRKEALVAEANGRMIDLSRPLNEDTELNIYTYKDAKGQEAFWHSSAHLMASAIMKLFPEAKLAIGPAIPDDFSAKFYYDIDLDHKLSESDLEAIEAEMQKIVKEDQVYQRKEMPRAEAIAYIKERDSNDRYKLEMAGEFEDETLTFYSHGDFIDMCRGPHIPSTGKIKAFKLLTVAGAYWRGDEKNKMLQRIYGVSFPSKKLLDEHLGRIEEAKKRDHRVVGKALDLFSIAENIGPGLVLWHPKGAIIRNLIETTWKDMHIRDGYDLVYTPHMARLKLWEISGHADFYTENMFKPNEVEGDLYQIKPMNCPFHIEIYRGDIRSFRDLPIKYAELGSDYRYERSGVLHGLMRVRGFTMDDAHIFCTPEQIHEQILEVCDLSIEMLKLYGFNDFHIYLSTRPEKYVGEPEQWDMAEDALRKALEERKFEYDVDEGGGAFYGPKIDIKIKDSIGRLWQCSTIQFDFNLPDRFDISYVDSDNKAKRPYMVHRAILGSLERFFGVLIEHYGGDFPIWLAPVQVRVLPVVDEVNEYADELVEFFKSAGVRVESDLRNEKIGYKIREAETGKIPYMLIVGKKELQEGIVSVRKHKQGDTGSFDPKEVLAEVLRKIKTKTVD